MKIIFFLYIIAIASIFYSLKEDFLDKTIFKYNKLYEKHKKQEISNIKYEYIPNNTNEKYYNKKIKKRSTFFSPYNYLSDLNINKPIQKDFPLRKHHCSNFNCQRQYMTCTSSHVPRYPFRKDPIIIKYNNY